MNTKPQSDFQNVRQADSTVPADPDKLRILVRDRDIAALAYGKCTYCCGSGFMRFRKQLQTKAGVKVPIRNEVPRRTGLVNPLSGKPNFVRSPNEVDLEICKCGIKRFIRLQATDYDEETGELFFSEPYLHMTEETKKEHAAIVEKLKAAQGGAP